MLDAEKAAYQALITDVDGWAVATHARERNDAIPVISMTGGSAHDWALRVCQTAFC